MFKTHLKFKNKNLAVYFDVKEGKRKAQKEVVKVVKVHNLIGEDITEHCNKETLDKIGRHISTVRNTVVTAPPAGALMKFKSKFTPNIEYVKVDGFYDIIKSAGGGRGFYYTILNGTGCGCTPEFHLEKVKVFETVAKMQHDIDNGLQNIF